MCIHPQLVVLAMLVAVGGCFWQFSPKGSRELDVPSAVGSTQPYLHETDDGSLLMSWIEAVDSTTHAFRFARHDGTSWSSPITLASDSAIFDNWADVPKVVTMPNGGVVGQYSTSSGSHYFANDHVVRRMTSGGALRPVVRLHDDETVTQHGFGSLTTVDEGVMSVWLDGRATKLIEGDYDESEWGDMQLHAAIVDETDAVRRRWMLDERVCDCCPTSIVRIARGVLVAYRDRGENERRDIKLNRYESGRWSGPYALHDDGWIISGCPVNGPALAADGDHVVAAWFTGAEERPRVHVAFSDDGGQTFGAPIVVDDSRPKGRVDIVLLPDRSALVSWIGVERRMNALIIARITAEDEPGEPSIIAYPKSTAFTGMPQLAVSGADVVLAWVDGGHPDSTEVLLERRPIATFR